MNPTCCEKCERYVEKVGDVCTDSKCPCHSTKSTQEAWMEEFRDGVVGCIPMGEHNIKLAVRSVIESRLPLLLTKAREEGIRETLGENGLLVKDFKCSEHGPVKPEPKCPKCV